MKACPVNYVKKDFGEEHEIFTFRDKGWLGKINGELLMLVIKDNFELFILCAFNNRRETLQKLIPKIFERISQGNLQNVIEIY